MDLAVVCPDGRTVSNFMSLVHQNVIQAEMVGGAAAFQLRHYQAHRPPPTARAAGYTGRHIVQRDTGWDRHGSNAFSVDLKPRSGGLSLPDNLRSTMESSLGADFSDVRVHVGQEAPSIGAVAFTWGSDLYFAPGQYNPNTLQGRMLIGHELTHVVQQRSGRVRNPFGSGVAVVQDRALEAEADRLGTMAAMSV